MKSEQEVVARFQEMRQSISTLFSKLSDIEQEAQEHDLVIKQLQPMDKSRKCYRMIGDVLVERTVAETLPAVMRNREGLESVMKQLQTQLEAQQKALAEFQQKYKIRIMQPGEQEAAEAQDRKPAAAGKDSKGGAGVLV